MALVLLTAMDDRVVFTLFALIQGDTAVFDVTVAANDYIYKLKRLIYEEGKSGVLHNENAKDLSLWVVSTFQRSWLMLSFMIFGQLNEPIPIAPFNTLVERVASLGTKFTSFATKLDEPTYKVSQYITKDPLQDHLYIIAQTLNAGKLSSF